MVIWLVLLIISYVLIYINNFIKDLTVVFFMGLVGCAIGTVLTYIAENKFGEKKE
jgi:Na+-driven multidrug efflux pump